MKPEAKARVAASVRSRLLTLSRQQGIEFDLILQRYALERFLYRLSITEHRNRFVLKGAMLLAVWQEQLLRSTRDLDLLAFGQIDQEEISTTIEAICSVDVGEDGLEFDLGAASFNDIRNEARYGGIRASFSARLGSARIPLQLDIGVGDIIWPGPVDITYPTMLDSPAPLLLGYTMVTVIAEKLEAIVDLGMANSRMKDFFDLWVLVTLFQHNSEQVAQAIRRTFDRREQEIPHIVPPGLTDAFANEASKLAQWQAFSKQIRSRVVGLEEVVSTVRAFAEIAFRDAIALTKR